MPHASQQWKTAQVIAAGSLQGMHPSRACMQRAAVWRGRLRQRAPAACSLSVGGHAAAPWHLPDVAAGGSDPKQQPQPLTERQAPGHMSAMAPPEFRPDQGGGSVPGGPAGPLPGERWEPRGAAAGSGAARASPGSTRAASRRASAGLGLQRTPALWATSSSPARSRAPLASASRLTAATSWAAMKAVARARPGRSTTERCGSQPFLRVPAASTSSASAPYTYPANPIAAASAHARGARVRKARWEAGCHRAAKAVRSEARAAEAEKAHAKGSRCRMAM
mmetsp:Transcript_1485/g.4659  ORF Transcript_1485/g.4659 Transcript_1485/m.4659 type:complete len:279 (-) Transcript_1485:191-1027(-)